MPAIVCHLWGGNSECVLHKHNSLLLTVQTLPVSGKVTGSGLQC